MKFVLIKSLLLSFLCLIMIDLSYASNKTDSLEMVLKKADELNKVNVLESLAKQYLAEREIDQSEKYYNLAIQEATNLDDYKRVGELLHSLGKLFYHYKVKYDTAIVIFKKAVAIRNDIADFEGANKSLVNIASIYILKSDYDSVIYFADSAIVSAERAGYRRGLGFAYSQKANGYHYRGKYEESIKYYQLALKIFDEIGYLIGVSSCNNNIGLGLQLIDKNEESMEYFRRSLDVAMQLNNIDEIATAYQNIGSYFYTVYRNEKKLLKTKQINEANYHPDYVDSCLFYYMKALELREQTGYEYRIASSLNNVGLAYSIAGEYELANEYLSRANEIFAKSENLYEIVVNLTTTGYNYNQIGKYREAIDLLNKSAKIARSIRLTENEMMNYRYLADAYDSIGEFRNAIKNLNLYIAYQDTTRDEKSRKIIEELETVYETEKKEQEIVNQKAINEKQKEINEQQRRQLIFSIVGVAIVLVFLVLMIIQYIQKRKANNLLVVQNEEILFQKKEIEMQRDEIEAQRNQVIKQRDLIAEQQNNIMDSIHYASRIQEAILPQNEFLERYLEHEYFVLFKPRDIVSGDFYWFGRKNHRNVIVAADCTGHGVPGAFMSMLGTAFLNEISANPEVEEAHEFLNTLREYVIKSLQQTGREGEQKDGMDLSLYIYDSENKQIQFAGANNPLFIVRPYEGIDEEYGNTRIVTQIFTQQETNKEYQIIQLKADKMPIGIYAENKPFSSINFPVKKGDKLYTFSDGYQDQFGGPKNKKFMIKRLKQLLVDSYNLSMTEQRLTLDSTLESWKSVSPDPEQVDDILVIGYQIS